MLRRLSPQRVDEAVRAPALRGAHRTRERRRSALVEPRSRAAPRGRSRRRSCDARLGSSTAPGWGSGSASASGARSFVASAARPYRRSVRAVFWPSPLPECARLVRRRLLRLLRWYPRTAQRAASAARQGVRLRRRLRAVEPRPGRPLPSLRRRATPVSSVCVYSGERLAVNKDRFIIGRGKQSSDLTIKDPNVSRQHAMVEFLNGQYYMVDMGSTNGVEYNGQRISRKPIAEGDVYRICDHEVRFTYR